MVSRYDRDHPKQGITREEREEIEAVLSELDERRSAGLWLSGNAYRELCLAALKGMEDARDAKRIDWLERLFKANGYWFPLVAIQTLPMQACVQGVNRHHGDEAGLITKETLREAVDAAIAKERGND